MKKYSMKISIFLLLFSIAFFINPNELYFSFKAEKEITVIRGILEEGVGEEKYKVKNVRHINGNIFFVETDSNNLLIQSKRQGSGTYYEVYEYGISFGRYE